VARSRLSGIPWTDGWEAKDSEQLHDLLEQAYWEHANRFMHEPFDPADA
jgi:hypothetical protein